MTEALVQAMREMVALRVQRDALASVVAIAWARAREGKIRDEHGMHAQLLAVGLIEETDWEAGTHRLSDFGREAMQGSVRCSITGSADDPSRLYRA
jgi:hypothetical protein